MSPKKKSEAYIETPFSCQRDGLTIRGLMFEPVNGRQNEEGKLPVAVVSHMFMVNYKLTVGYARFLAEKGYLAVCYDFNGGGLFSKSDGKSVDMTVLTEVKDLEAVIEAVLAHPKADPARLLLMGCSQGGMVSALVAARHPGMVEKLVLFYPALSIPDDARKGQMLFAKFDPVNVPEVFRCGFMKLGRKYVTDVNQMDAFAEISAYEGPVLILHGTADTAVDVSNSKKAAEVYKNARLELLEGAGHGFFKQNKERALQLLGEFV